MEPEPHAEEVTGYLDPWRAGALASLLGLPEPDGETGLPLLWHLIYLLGRARPDDQGGDGHPRSGIPAPPEPGRRRMWAGGRVTTLAPLRPDRPATRRTTLRGQSQKQGRSGPLTFVTVAQDIYQDGQHVIAEEQDILYRPAENRITPVASGEGLSEAPVLRLVTDPVLLFRFSALTYNGHRIHYDRDYARDREGYAGLLVHGPLQALMMAEAARELSGRDAPARFEYRLVAPLFDGRGLNAFADADADGFTTAIQDDSGRTTATGRFVPA